MGREEDREGKERRGKRKREEERRGGSEDEGEGGSTTLSDASGHVTNVEDECRVEGERVKKKTCRRTTRGDGGEKTLCTGQRNEAIRFWDLTLNSGTRSQISQCDWLRSPKISRSASHLSNVPLRDDACCHWGSVCLWAQTAGSDTCMYDTTPLWECKPDTIHLLHFALLHSVLWGKRLASWHRDKPSSLKN